MGSERGSYKMGVDIAVMREMAYRQQLELMELIKSNEFKQASAPPNQTSLPDSKPNSEKRSNQIPKPRPKLSQNSSPISSRLPGPSFPGTKPKTMMIPVSLPPRGPSSVPRPIFSSQTRPKSVPRPIFSSQTRPKSVQRPIFSSQAHPKSVQRPIFSSKTVPKSVPRHFFSSPSGRISSAPRSILSCQTGPRLKSVIAGPRPFMPQSPRPSLTWQKTSHVGPNTSPRPALLPPPPPVGQRFMPALGSSYKRKEAPTPTHQLQVQANHNDGKVRKLFCEVCDVQCASFPNLQMHLMGQKHKAQVKKGKGVGQTSSEIETRKYCELCDTWCMNEFSMKQHVSGRSHILKLHAAQRKN